MRSHEKSYKIKIMFDKELEIDQEGEDYELWPEKTTADDIIEDILSEGLLPGSEVKDYHLMVEDSEWPLSGSSKTLWSHSAVRAACTSKKQGEATEFTLFKTNEEGIYTRMPGFTSKSEKT
eukprot:UN26559